MNSWQICRVCLRGDGERHSIADAIKPPPGTALPSILIFYEFINEVLTNDKLAVDQICCMCSNAICKLYSLLEKTENANKILLALKAAQVRLKRVNLDLKEEISLDESEPINVQLENISENRSANAEISENVSINTSAVYREDEKIELLPLISDHSEEKVIVPSDTVSTVDTTKQDSETQVNNLNNEEPPAKKIALDNTLDSIANDLSKIIDDAFGFELSEPTVSISRSIERTQPDSTDEGCSKQTECSVETLMKCRMCEEMFNVNDFEKHRLHHMINPFEVGRLIYGRLYCILCCEWHRGVSSLKNHAKHIHRRSENYQPADIDLENKTFQCLVCLRKPMSAASLKEHMGNHIIACPFSKGNIFCPPSKYSCLYCSNKYTTRNYLAQHIMAVHGSDQLKNCKICGLRDLHMSEVDQHLDEFAREYSCLKCSFSFQDAVSMSAHEQYHNGGTTKCEDCRLAFQLTVYLDRHNETHDSLHKCPTCKMPFSNELKLKHHAYHHKKGCEELATKELVSQKAISRTEKPAKISATTKKAHTKIGPEFKTTVEVDDDVVSAEVEKQGEYINDKINSIENPLKNSSSAFVSRKDDLTRINEQSNVAVTARKDFPAALLTPVVENVNPTSGLVISQVASGDMVIHVGSGDDGLPDLQQKNLEQISLQPNVLNNVNQSNITPNSSESTRCIALGSVAISNAQQSQPNERPRIFVRTDLMTTKSNGDNDRRN